MLLSHLLGERTKEMPSDAAGANHALLLRGGFIKQVAGGIYSLLPLGRRATLKIENIFRSEMNAIGGQEVSLPVVMPRELWEESGRYSSIGEEMVRFKDRNGRDMLLGMTHEEAAVHLARASVSSYNQLPFMIYQIQTKFRDEARSRGGLIRVREFIMKDGYSFHASNKDLRKYYDKVHEAYLRVFRKIGLKNVISVKSDTGMMGGAVAHEFMLLTDIGEDTLVICPECDYKANMEIAVGGISKQPRTDSPLKEVFTGDAKEIADVAKLLGISACDTVKAVSFAIKGSDEIALVFIRGDLEVNEAKLRRELRSNVAQYSIADGDGLAAGSIGPIGAKPKKCRIVFDASLEGEFGMVCGADKPEYHLSGLNIARDLKVKRFVDVAKVPDGARCSCCGAPLKLQRGIEIGNIFQLGDKYTRSMGMTVAGKDGNEFSPVMGCYGMGVGRALASLVEESHDDKGIIFPLSVAPFEVIISVLRADDKEVKRAAEKLYKSLLNKGVEVLLDDRDCSPGVKFADADLIGVPIRLIVSPRNLKDGNVELSLRDGSLKTYVALGSAVKEVQAIIKAAGK